MAGVKGKEVGTNKTKGINTIPEIQDSPVIILRPGVKTKWLRIWGRITTRSILVPLVEGDGTIGFGWTGHRLGPNHND